MHIKDIAISVLGILCIFLGFELWLAADLMEFYCEAAHYEIGISRPEAKLLCENQ